MKQHSPYRAVVFVVLVLMLLCGHAAANLLQFPFPETKITFDQTEVIQGGHYIVQVVATNTETTLIGEAGEATLNVTFTNAHVVDIIASDFGTISMPPDSDSKIIFYEYTLEEGDSRYALIEIEVDDSAVNAELSIDAELSMVDFDDGELDDVSDVKTASIISPESVDVFEYFAHMAEYRSRTHQNFLDWYDGWSYEDEFQTGCIDDFSALNLAMLSCAWDILNVPTNVDADTILYLNDLADQQTEFQEDFLAGLNVLARPYSGFEQTVEYSQQTSNYNKYVKPYLEDNYISCLMEASGWYNEGWSSVRSEIESQRASLDDQVPTVCDSFITKAESRIAAGNGDDFDYQAIMLFRALKAHYTRERDYLNTVHPECVLPPEKPADPSPSNDATDISTVDTALGWSCTNPDGDTVYDLYLSTAAFTFADPPDPTKTNITENTTVIETFSLIPESDYYWGIAAKDAYSKTCSDIWHFQTGSAPGPGNQAPATPTPYYPEDGAIDVSTISWLQWRCSDPDGDTLHYDVYLGTDQNALTCVKSGATLTQYDPDLTAGTTYYWKVTATDGVHSVTGGPWNFTTRTEEIADPAPVADFTADPTSGIEPLTVQFTDLSSESPTGWAWYFGDEDFKDPWTQMTGGAGWSVRERPTSVALPDGSIVLMGGIDTNYKCKNDVWRSTDGGATWTQMTASAAWSARCGHTSVALHDGSIVLMGGHDGGAFNSKNDVWRSTDNGATWTQMTAAAAWPARYEHTSVALPDGSIVLMGGYNGTTLMNDVWRSTDNGATWTQMTAGAGWSGRYWYSSVALPDGSIVLMGGYGGGDKNDVWRSTDNGATWTQMTASAAWSARCGHTSVALPDGSIILMAGYDVTWKNDVWRSTDNGATWTQMTAGVTWTGRAEHSSVALPDGSIVLMGGYSMGSDKNDVWRLTTAGSSAQNPSHTYAKPGVYQVMLQASNAAGTDTMRKAGYISVSEATPPEANFTANVTSGTEPLTVQFTDLSSEDPTGWAWYFGDENCTAAWTEMTASAGWTGRYGHTSVALPDGSIVVMGGNDGSFKNDVWRSTDSGATWKEMTANAAWSARYDHSAVALPDGSIVLMGGYSYGYKNDVWRSTDNGATWTQVNASAGWTGRTEHSSVALPDGSIVLMGGYGGYDVGDKNDVWRSTDGGATWTEMTASAAWSPRAGHASAALPDGSIVLMGGYPNDVWRSTDNGATWTQMTGAAAWSEYLFDHTGVALPDGSIILMGGRDLHIFESGAWRSTDNGATWTQMNASAGWSGRHDHSSVVLPDGSVVLMGGYDSGNRTNDVWRLTTAGSSEQHPSHTYTRPGVYQVVLQAYNVAGSDSMRKTEYIGSAPAANFTADVTSGTAPLAVTFTDTSTNYPTTWSWSFGDGNTSTEQNPVHTYTTPGTYTVNLTVSTGIGSDTLSRPEYITVTVRGDFNGNGAVDVGDVSKVAYMVVGKAAANLAADFNRNSAVDIGDAAKIAYYFVGKTPAL